MKKTILILFIFLSLCGCSKKEDKLNEKTVEEMSERVTEESTTIQNEFDDTLESLFDTSCFDDKYNWEEYANTLEYGKETWEKQSNSILHYINLMKQNACNNVITEEEYYQKVKEYIQLSATIYSYSVDGK